METQRRVLNRWIDRFVELVSPTARTMIRYGELVGEQPRFFYSVRKLDLSFAIVGFKFHAAFTKALLSQK